MKTYVTATSGNLIDRIDTCQALTDAWPLFAEGLENLNDFRRTNANLQVDHFFKVVCRVVKQREGLVLRVLSKNEKPLGFGVAYGCSTEIYPERICHIYAVYSNGKNSKAISDLLTSCQEWAQKMGFKELQACSSRFSGATFRWFEAKHGFKRAQITFKKELV